MHHHSLLSTLPLLLPSPLLPPPREQKKHSLFKCQSPSFYALKVKEFEKKMKPSTNRENRYIINIKVLVKSVE